MKTNSNKLVFEYESLTKGDSESRTGLKEKDFDELRRFILKQSDEDAAPVRQTPFEEFQEAGACMTLKIKNGKEVLTVQNYVGTIALSGGTTIEILPKIGGEKDAESSRKLVVEMLKVCGLISYKSFQNANLAFAKMPIFEIYIRIFLNEVFALYKRGLKSGYEEKQENEKFLKGKLLFSEHIKRNFSHAERFFVQYDEFTVNRPENRLIKTTLAFLKKYSTDLLNQRDVRRLLMAFDEIEESKNVDSDFLKCTNDRNMQEYQKLLSWCKLFLHGFGFSNYAGKHDTVALLFPMEKLFEKYIAKKLYEPLSSRGWKVYTQYTEKYLFDHPEKMFNLRPDIYIKKDNVVIVLDTKWKVLDNSRENYGISQADMYQMYVYHKRFDTKRVFLLYPLKDGTLNEKLSWGLGTSEMIVSARFITVESEKDLKSDIENLVTELENIYTLAKE